MTSLCPHGRLETAYCEPCAEVQAIDPPPEVLEKIKQRLASQTCKHGEPWGDCPCCYEVKPYQPEQSKHDAPYYDFHEGVRCVQDLIETNEMSWNQANILKAVVRWGCKGGSSSLEYDIEKIIWFANRALSEVRSKRSLNADAPGNPSDT